MDDMKWLEEQKRKEKEFIEKSMKEDQEKWDRDHPKPPEVTPEMKSAIRGTEDQVQNKEHLFEREADIDDLSHEVIKKMVELRDIPAGDERRKAVSEWDKKIAKRQRELGGNLGGKGVSFPWKNGEMIEVYYDE